MVLDQSLSQLDLADSYIEWIYLAIDQLEKNQNDQCLNLLILLEKAMKYDLNQQYRVH